MIDADLGEQESLMFWMKVQDIRYWYGRVGKLTLEGNVTNRSQGSRWRLYTQAFPHIGGYLLDHHWQAY